jgi:hypothetical protein
VSEVRILLVAAVDILPLHSRVFRIETKVALSGAAVSVDRLRTGVVTLGVVEVYTIAYKALGTVRAVVAVVIWNSGASKPAAAKVPGGV